MRTGRKKNPIHLGVCRFTGCDAEASATVGTVRLCALHESYVVQLMDRAVGPTAEDVLTITSDGGPLIALLALDSPRSTSSDL
jgi:hypothetical protein